jgi:hypothetical protein
MALLFSLAQFGFLITKLYSDDCEDEHASTSDYKD